MIILLNTLKSWQSEDFTPAFKQEVSTLSYKDIPLQQGLSLSSYVSDEKISAIINRTEETPSHISITAGIFYYGIIAGCSCADDPTPQDTQTEYCEMHFSIDKQTAETTVTLISE